MRDLSALHDMALFVEVARAASFSLASRNLNVPGATLSRRIAAMEREFGVRLFNRTTRQVALTEAGQLYFERCGPLVDEARQAQESVRETAAQLSGHVRISMPVDLGVGAIAPLLSDFARQFPGITFDPDLSPRYTDLVGEQVDIAIRLGKVTNEQLVARCIGHVDQRLYAAPAYLTLRGRPDVPADLRQHECILLRGTQLQTLWQLQSESEAAEVAVCGRFMANNVGVMRVLAEGAMGIALLAPFLVREQLADGRLVAVMPAWRGPYLPIHGVTASRLQPARIRALIEFLAAGLTMDWPFATQPRNTVESEGCLMSQPSPHLHL